MTGEQYVKSLRNCAKILEITQFQMAANKVLEAADYMEALLAENEHLRENTKMIPKWRHGHWKHNDNYVLWAEKYICSECGRNAPSDGDYRHDLTDYCPNCGARMDGGADNGE